jgi:hypothetical protein
MGCSAARALVNVLLMASVDDWGGRSNGLPMSSVAVNKGHVLCAVRSFSVKSLVLAFSLRRLNC